MVNALIKMIQVEEKKGGAVVQQETGHPKQQLSAREREQQVQAHAAEEQPAARHPQPAAQHADNTKYNRTQEQNGIRCAAF